MLYVRSCMEIAPITFLIGERKRGQYKLGDVNATVFPASLWEEIIEQHLVRNTMLSFMLPCTSRTAPGDNRRHHSDPSAQIWVLFCVFLPAEFKWLEKVDFASHFLLRLRNLRRSVIWGAI